MNLQKRLEKMLAVLALFLCNALLYGEVLLEAEHFADLGGWKIDQQFSDVMGSAYLMAHGLGRPVENARTYATFPSPGSYVLWVRTKNWVPGPWEAPGRFEVLINHQPVSVVFGTESGWGWQRGGIVEINDSPVLIELKDLSGFNARCDALFFTRDSNFSPFNKLPEMRSWRQQVAARTGTSLRQVQFDVVIVGGGIAGCAAALAAAEQGLQVALIHDRPVLGGNASGEVRVHTLGIAGKGEQILQQLNTDLWPNGSPLAIEDDQKRHQAIERETKIRLFLNWRAFAAHTQDARILRVDAKDIRNGDVVGFTAPLFIDCTGDGWVGYWAGADFRYGRESYKEFGEQWDKHGDLWSPLKPDQRVMGASLLWYSSVQSTPTTFPEVPWAMPVAKDYVALEGEWYWEYSDQAAHQIENAEAIRDHLLRAIFGSFANAKKAPENATRQLEWVGYILGKRESRRLMGDYIYTMKDMTESRQFPDAIAEGKRSIDVHYQRILTGLPYDFLSTALFKKTDMYYIPFRCLYSRNIENLMMAGRCFSCSHIGLGGPRVMNTTGQMGIAVGYAAGLCLKYDISPRQVYQLHINELRELVGYETQAIMSQPSLKVRGK
jgi:hypothetical protein